MGDTGVWGWQLDQAEREWKLEQAAREARAPQLAEDRMFGRWRAPDKDHNHGCVDPFCQGCHWKCAANNSQCFTTNVEIMKILPNNIVGISPQGEVVIHRKYLSIMKKMAPPRINLISHKFKMIIMQNGKTLTTTPGSPLRCIWIEQGDLLEDGVVIHHPRASLPTMEGAFIFAPVSCKCVNL
jgi:hypothetical protein